jgi:hypothetical protein
VGADNAYEDSSTDTDTRCNVVIENIGAMGGGQPRGANHVTAYNYLYQSSSANFEGASNASFVYREASGDDDLCFWRKRWTAPELVCIPRASTTAASPHLDGMASCDPGLAAPLGIAELHYPAEPVPEPAAPELPAAGALALAAWARARRRSASAATAVHDAAPGSGSVTRTSS